MMLSFVALIWSSYFIASEHAITAGCWRAGLAWVLGIMLISSYFVLERSVMLAFASANFCCVAVSAAPACCNLPSQSPIICLYCPLISDEGFLVHRAPYCCLNWLSSYSSLLIIYLIY